MGRALLVDAVGRVGASFFWFLQSVSGYARVSYGVLAREGDRQGGNLRGIWIPPAMLRDRP